MHLPTFNRIDFEADHGVWLGPLPSALHWSSSQFDTAWASHPAGFHQVRIFGKLVDVPRWSETYGRDYPFAGTTQLARPIPDYLAPLLDWSRAHVDPRYNGLLLNWYDGALGHYIGRHRDDEKELIADAAILTISFGEARTFRMRRYKGDERHDIDLADGSALVLPYATNMAYTHEIPKSKRATGRRISVTIRAFG